MSDLVQISQIRDGKSPLSQPALIVSDPVQISQIRDGKSPLSQPALIVSDPVQVSQIRDGKSPLGYLGGSICEISLEALGFCQVTKGGYQRKAMVP